MYEAINYQKVIEELMIKNIDQAKNDLIELKK